MQGPTCSTGKAASPVLILLVLIHLVGSTLANFPSGFSDLRLRSRLGRSPDAHSHLFYLVAKADEDAAPRDSVSRTIEIQATPEECFQIATGYEDYPKWAGSIETVEIVARRPDGLASQVDFKMGLFGINVKNLFQYKYDRPNRMDWTVVRGSVKELIGSYQFDAIGPEQTRVKYDLMVDPGFPLPGPIRKATSRAICNAALQELKRYTELPSTLQRLRRGGGARQAAGPAPTDLVESVAMIV